MLRDLDSVHSWHLTYYIDTSPPDMTHVQSMAYAQDIHAPDAVRSMLTYAHVFILNVVLVGEPDTRTRTRRNHEVDRRIGNLSANADT